MYILGIETTGPLGSVAIIDEEGRVEMNISTEEMNHLKDLMPMAGNIMEKLGISPADLSAVAASIGPGSFTGIRIGVSTARAISQALCIPCIAVPTLGAFRKKGDGKEIIAVIFNARRGQVYGAVFGSDGEEILTPGPYMLEDVLAVLQIKGRTETVRFYGDGIDAYADKLEDFALANKEERYQTADMIARDGIEAFRAGKTLTYSQLLPEYMRVTEAEQKLKDGSLARERAAKMERFKSR